MISLLLCLLPSAALYADNLAIWSSSPSVHTAVEATQGALFRLERWSEYWCRPLNPSKYEAFFFSVDPHQASLLYNPRLHFNPTPTFLGVTFYRTLSFSKHVSSPKAKFFPLLKALGCISSPIPLLLSEASLPPLRVILTHFALSTYERTLRLPTSFSHFRCGQT